MRQHPLVAVIIVNYKGYQLTCDCLRSFEKVTYANYLLIVVDNASGDDSVPRLQKEFAGAHFIQSLQNRGFTGGNNLGLEKAKGAGADYVFFLNNDTTVSPNVLDELVGFLSQNPEVGIAGPLTYYHEASEIVSFGGGNIERNTGIYTHLNKGKTLGQLGQQVIYCSFIEGAAMFMRTELAVKLGGFSDCYFLTSEESELCVRTADEGYRLAMVTSCSVWHKVSRSLASGSPLRTYFVARNRLMFVKRNALGFGANDLGKLVASYAKSFAWLLFKGRDLPAARSLALGVFDFFTGSTGAGRYAKKLNAAD
jgi:GT2 family glycosyltransferase